MAKIQVITGFGYYRDQIGRIAVKVQLPPGEHELATGLTYYEVSSQAELDAIGTFMPAPTQEELNEKKIGAEIRRIAVESLKAAGELPVDYE